jgi:hypothetical protein
LIEQNDQRQALQWVGSPFGQAALHRAMHRRAKALGDVGVERRTAAEPQGVAIVAGPAVLQAAA